MVRQTNPAVSMIAEAAVTPQVRMAGHTLGMLVGKPTGTPNEL